MNLFNEVYDKFSNLSNNIQDLQQRFLESKLGNVINTALDNGLKSVLPDWIEEDIINLKDSIMSNGLIDGIKESVQSIIEYGKCMKGIISGKFENVSQLELAIKNGGVLEKISDFIDFSIDKVNRIRVNK